MSSNQPANDRNSTVFRILQKQTDFKKPNPVLFDKKFMRYLR